YPLPLYQGVPASRHSSLLLSIHGVRGQYTGRCARFFHPTALRGLTNQFSVLRNGVTGTRPGDPERVVWFVWSQIGHDWSQFCVVNVNQKHKLTGHCQKITIQEFRLNVTLRSRLLTCKWLLQPTSHA
ncbi:hypothetical protein VDGL01_04372, partial [Verticillium dahliae]